MITQLFRVIVNGINITGKISNTSINEQMNRMYNTASFVTDVHIITKSIVKIELGDKIFDGFVFSSTKNNKNTYTIQCRTAGGYLTTPFESNDTECVIPAKTSNEVCSYYANKFNIPIVITSIDLDFGGDYVQTGTPLSALVSIANTTGADYWWDGTSIRIEPAKWIEEEGEEIPASDIFDFIPFEKTIEQRGIKTVIIGTSSTATDKTINMSCSAEVDACNSLATIRVIPHSSYQSSTGLNSITEVQTPLSYVGVISMQSYLSLEADIVSVSNIKINEATVTDYTFVNNTIIFTSPKRGRISVDYVGYGYTGYADTKVIENEKVCSFTVFYGECEAFYHDSILSCSTNMSMNECGGTIVEMPKELNYVKGFSFNSYWGIPYIYFYDESSKINININTISADIARLEPGVISLSGGGGYSHKFRFTAKSVDSVQSMGVDVPYTWDSDYVYFSEYYLGVTVSYVTVGRTHTVQDGNIPNSDIKMVISGELEGDPCEYSLDGSSGESCNVGDSITISIVDIHGIDLNSVKGRTVIVTDPNDLKKSYVANGRGEITINGLVPGNYNIDTNSMWSNSYIKFISYVI